MQQIYGYLLIAALAMAGACTLPRNIYIPILKSKQDNYWISKERPLAMPKIEREAIEVSNKGYIRKENLLTIYNESLVSWLSHMHVFPIHAPGNTGGIYS